MKDFCFFVGLEILDNMPHDRLYTGGHQGLKGEKENRFTHVSTIEIKGQGKSEELIEHIVPVGEVQDHEIQLFLKLLNTQPEEDTVSVTKRLNSQGLLKRLIDNLPSFSSTKTPDTQ